MIEPIASQRNISKPDVTAGGLASPIHDAQQIFRGILTALSEPGRVLRLSGLPDSGLPLGAASLAVLLTLADGDTPLWLDDRATVAAPYLRFHTGATIVDSKSAARFALIADAQHCPRLDDFAAGSEDYPDRSATLIIEVARFAEQGPIVFRGPGIPDRRDLTIEALPPDFLAAWSANRALFPRGVDVILTCGTEIVGLPRRVMLEGPCM
jgi:alpha-D-ribose 1-methylphosphonate 5-triphosphate synthase subunit PhnH